MDEKETKLDEELNENVPEGSDEEKEPEVAEGSDEPKEEAADKKQEDVEGQSVGGASDDSKSAKKKSKHDKKQDAMKEKVEELEDRVKRQLAEFENFRNRTDKEKQQMFETGAKSVIEKILPIVDNFERGLATVPEEDKGTPFAEGMEKIYKQLMTELEKMEVKPIEAVGTEFNPDLHNAVMQVESEEYETGIVAQELQKGYTYRDQVVRHSMVAVVQ
ncbi:MAG: nucleotide exchange factor GrpE [Lachnospiraceae bacterium]|nr:nucleotide exchange factor GrpE [Lachnospiraceae bacterium]